MNLNRYMTTIRILVIALLLGLLLLGTVEIFRLVYIGIFALAVVRVLTMQAKRRTKLFFCLVYFLTLAFQISVSTQMIVQTVPWWELLLRRLYGMIIMVLPMIVSRYISVGKYSQFYLPSLQDIETVSFAEVQARTRSLQSMIDFLGVTRRRLTKKNIMAITEDLPRHDSFRYINNGSLTEEYFQEARRHLEDPHLYIIISQTGSAASEVISIFTQKQYNHASLSFDRDLRTIISYNGGESVYPPGLNQEMLEFFHKKPDASVIVYKLPCTPEQKALVLQKVEEINREGSAYNILGLMVKYSHKPNIMFCSQFVYEMLALAGLSYFEEKGRNVTPTDLVEKDYYRRLLFEYEIHFQ